MPENKKHVRNIPVLVGVYVKFDSIPDDWQDMAEDFKKWKAKNPEDDFNPSNLNLLHSVAEVLTREIGDSTKSKKKYEIYIRDGSLIIEVLTLIPITDFLIDDTKNLIKSIFHGEILDPRETLDEVKKIIRDLRPRQKQAEVKKIVHALTAEQKRAEVKKIIHALTAGQKQAEKAKLALMEIIKADIGRKDAGDSGTWNGVLANILKFDKYLNEDKSNAPIEDRVDFMKKARNQIKIIKNDLRIDMDKKVFYFYLIIVTRNLSHIEGDINDRNKDIKSYNDYVDEILKIREDFFNERLN